MKSVLSDGCVVLGIAASIYGVWLVYPPAAFILGGILLAAIGFFSGK